MRVRVAALLLVPLAGCGGPRAPLQISAPIASANAQAMQCVERRLENMGYRQVSRDPQSGTIVASQINERPFYLRWIGVRDTEDRLIVSVSGERIQVTAASSNPDAPGTGTADRAAGAASADTRRDAERLLEACGSR